MEEDVTSNVTGNQVQDTVDNPQPGFWAVIPATVRYDPSLPMGAKMLYGEIAALTNMKGYCWASNAYFTKNFDVKDRAISGWISALREAGHIIVYYEYFPNSKKIKERRIRLPIAITKAVQAIRPEGGDPSAGDDNPPSDRPDSAASGAKICSTNPVVVQKFAPSGGAKICGDNNTNSNKAAAAEIFKPPDERSAAAAVPSKNETNESGPPDLKQTFLNADPSLIFTQGFYQEAAAYLAENGLDVSYIAWIYQQSRKKKPNNLRAMLRTLFFAEDLTELFKASFRPPPDPVFLSCPACKTDYDDREKRCPHCGLAKDASPQAVELAKHLAALPPDRRREYEKRIEQIMFAGHGFEKKQSLLAGLKNEFGLPETG